jgi:hypothetical protein
LIGLFSGVTGTDIFAEYFAIFTQYRIPQTIPAMQAKMETMGIRPNTKRMQNARPRVLPGSGSPIIFLSLNSFDNEDAIRETTTNCHIRLNKGISSSHTFAGVIVRHCVEQRFRHLCKVRQKKIRGIRAIPKTMATIVVKAMSLAMVIENIWMLLPYLNLK